MSRNTIQINADEKNFPQARTFVEKTLTWRYASGGTASEVTTLFEALLHEIASQIGDEGTAIEISRVRELGRAHIDITYPGKRFSVPEADGSSDPCAKIIDEYSDRFSCSYQSGDNNIRISVGQSAWAFLIPNLIAVVAAVIVGTVLEFTVDEAGRQMLATEWVAPLEKLFTNAMLMIGAPMTLFSLLKNVTDAFIVAEHKSSARRLFVASVTSSVVIIALALVMGFVFAQWILAETGITERVDIGLSSWSLASAVDQIIPSSIIQPFETISPLPMIIVALLVVAALNSIGKSFDGMKSAIDACYDLFSGILQIVMTAFPLACFLLFLEVLLHKEGLTEFLQLLFIGVVVCACMLPLLVLYALRLKAHGVNLREFGKKFWVLIKENFAMGSVIDAVPFNTRFCAKNFGISRERLEKELPILAQVSLDGNCFILMLLASIYIFFANCDVSWIHIVVLALIVLFLSFGAPNQPGSILIGMLVILTYLHSDIAISLALCFELFFGGLQNILNVISSVVMVVENECRARDDNAAS